MWITLGVIKAQQAQKERAVYVPLYCLNKRRQGLYTRRALLEEVPLYWGAPKSLQMVTAAIKLRRLLLGRKGMTNPGSIFKSRDINLPTNVHLVKAMVFPVVMYGCESWTVKKAEC